MTTLEVIKQTLQVDYDQEEEAISLYDEIARILAPFEGKPLTKRLGTAVAKVLEPKGYKVSWSPEYGMYYIKVWKTWDDRFNFLVGYESTEAYHLGEPHIQHSGFAYWSNCYGHAAKLRNEKRLATLRDPARLKELAKRIDNYRIAAQSLTAMLDDDEESRYSIIKAMDLKREGF